MSVDPTVSPQNLKKAMELEAVYTANWQGSRNAETPHGSSATALDENHDLHDQQTDIRKKFSEMRKALNGLMSQRSDEFQKPDGR